MVASSVLAVSAVVGALLDEGTVSGLPYVGWEFVVELLTLRRCQARTTRRS